MDPKDDRYQYVLTIILISLIIAAGISVFFTAGPSCDQAPDTPDNIQKVGMTNDTPETSGSWIVRILWYDDLNRTYSFQDYATTIMPDPDTYTFSGDSPTGAKPAMMRFLSWDGVTERTIGARYIIDQETVTAILNRYSLMSSKEAMPTPTIEETRTPVPTESPIPGMLTPEAGIICRNDDGSYTAWFGYQSRHEYPVSLPVGEQNRFYPGEADRGQPVQFMPGIHHDAFSITYPGDVTNQVWSLMGTTVSAGTVPEVNTSITIEPASGYAPLDVLFSERSSGGLINNPLTSVWDLGDGTTSSKTGSLHHRYEIPGTYPITFTVSNRCSTASASGQVQVYGVSYSWVRNPDDPRTIRFSDTSGGDPTVWFWDFGDGYTSWEQNPVHTYLQSGSFHIGLTASGSHGKGIAVQVIPITQTGE